MECQVEKKEHFRHLLLFEFSRKAKAAEAARPFVPFMVKTLLAKEQLEHDFHVLKVEISIQTRFSPNEDYAMRMVGSTECYSLRSPSEKSDNYCRTLLSTVSPT